METGFAETAVLADRPEVCSFVNGGGHANNFCKR